MNAPLSIILNKTILYNRKIAILFFISLYILVFITFFEKSLNTGFGNLFLVFTLYISISICLIKLIKEKNYTFYKFSFNTDEYKLCSRKDKITCYNESFSNLLKDINSKNLGYNENEQLNKFLINFNNDFISKLKENITFERFNDYFTNSKGNKTTGQLFYVQYRSSLIKIIKDFIIKTNRLEDVSNEIISSFISELTNHRNLYFDTSKGLHYNDKFVIEFLENNHKQESTIEQEYSVSKRIRPIKLKHISKTQFYKVLKKISVDLLNVKLTKENEEELKSFVGTFFTSDLESKFHFKPQIKQLSFLNLNNSTDFILSIKYLIKSNIIVNNISGNMQNLEKVISKEAHKSTAENRAEIFRTNINLIDFTLEKQKNIDFILQELKLKTK